MSPLTLSAGRASWLAMLGLCLFALSARAVTLDEETRALDAWRQARIADLTGDNGWLSLVGLYWLDAPVNGVGNGSSNAVEVDSPRLGPHAGDFLVDAGGVTFAPTPGSCLRAGTARAGRVAMQPDVSGAPTVLTCGSLRFHVIQRAGRYAIRVRDLASPARRAFTGIDAYPVALDWVVDARFEPYEPVRHVGIVNVLGMELDMISPGAVVFEREGREWRIDALLESPDATQLFLMFADGTSGHGTYGAGRFLYTPLSDGGRVVVDFNRAHSPPCAFTSFATCPLPPSQNRLSLRIEAGEKFGAHAVQPDVR